VAPPRAPGGGWASGLPLKATAAFLGLYALLAAPFALHEGFELEGVVLSSILALALAALSAIDLAEYRLPDALTLPLTALGVAATSLVLDASLWWQAASALIGFAVLAGVAVAYAKLRGRAGLGLGDAKLLAAAGAWLGAQALPSVLLLACGSALVGLLIRGWRTRSLAATSRVPFGPFLAFGTWLVWLYGPLLSAEP
jgi:leader peptidase (prepilin peptidase)/N-methyltransferase